MKNKIKSFALLAAVAGLVACEEVGVYETAPFVSMDVRTAVVEESNPATVWSLPVHLYNYGSATTVTYTVEAVTATAGVDYTVADGSGVLNFTGNDTQNISVSVTGQPGVYTGNLTFQIKLASATNDVQLGAISTCTVSIKDKDHPLTAMLGDYVANGTCGFGQAYQWPLTITPDEEDVHKVWLDYIIGFVAMNGVESWGNWSVYGIVSDDMKTITIPYLQQTDIGWADDEDWIQFCNFDIADNLPVPVETPGAVKLVWNEEFKGYVNDGRIAYGALSGKLGNYYCLYYMPNSILFKKK